MLPAPIPDTEISKYWRICISVWSLLTILLGLPGNIFVLHASIRHEAIKFGKVPVIFIQNIAFADVCNILVVCVATAWTPLVSYTTAAHFYNDSTPGKVLCFALYHVSYWCPLAAITMICSLNVCKLLCLLYPLRGVERMERWGYLVVGFSWALYLPRLVVFFLDGVNLSYHRDSMRLFASFNFKMSFPNLEMFNSSNNN